MNADLADLHRIYHECFNRLESFSKRVAENRDVMAASEFARWLSFSGIPRLLKANSNPAPLKVDGAHLQWKIDDLLAACNERFRTNNQTPTIEKSEVESMREKMDKMASNLDLMAAQISRLTSAVQASVSAQDDHQSVLMYNVPIVSVPAEDGMAQAELRSPVCGDDDGLGARAGGSRSAAAPALPLPCLFVTTQTNLASFEP
jgi:hypothetical protein